MENLAPEDSTVKKGRESGSKSLKISLGRPQVALSGFIAIKSGVKLREGKYPQHSAQYLPFSGGPSFFSLLRQRRVCFC